ncbi:MAG: hypothetical protein INR73_26965 [Williamsia sp.]|nr:hypothetical protein [Williamsia sp.]
MNTENLRYLKDNLKYHGFGEKLYGELEQNINAGMAGFQLRFNESLNGKSFEAVLNFRRGEGSDMYYFNSYAAKLDKGIKENVEQTFYINKGKGITAKEAFNLLDGRSVYKELANKEGVAYQAWVQLDPKVVDKNGNHILKQYHEHYGFDLGKSLVSLPVKELATDEDRSRLIRSLERGNLQAVTFDRDGKSERMFLEANPQYKTLTVYDSGMKRVRKSEGQTTAREKTVEQKETTPKETAGKSADKKSERKIKTGNKETGLLPKKRTNLKKGLVQ